jgi:hypothetical protein
VIKMGTKSGIVGLSLAALPLALGVVSQAMAPARALAAAPRPAVSPTPGQLVKFYVVAPSFNGQPEFLFEIAQRTLGDGNRFEEIFDLTKGRLQADGRRLTDPTKIEPGWVLILPGDASGPGVQQGRIPLPQTGPARHSGTGLTVPLAGAGTGGGAVLLAGAGLYLRRRRRRLPEGIDGDGTARSVARTPAAPARSDEAAFGDVEPEPLFDSSPALSSSAQPSAPAWDVPPEPPDAEPREETPPAIVVRDVPPGTGGSATEPVPLVRDHDVYPAPADPPTVHEVAFGDDLVTVRLSPAASITWRPLPHDVPPGRAVVCVGAGRRGCLFLDLAGAPGVVGIDGPAEAAERLAEALVSQLAVEPAAASIVLVGDVLGGLDGGPGVRRVPDLGAASTTSSGLVVAFVPAAYDGAESRLTGPLNGPRVVQVRLGGAKGAAWSFTVLPDRARWAWHGGDPRADEPATAAPRNPR